MPDYLLYYMNPVSGHIDRRETLHAGDDVAAVHMLQRRQFDVPVELWRDGRKVSRQDGPLSLLRAHLLDAAAPVPGPPDRTALIAPAAAGRRRSRNNRPSG